MRKRNRALMLLLAIVGLSYVLGCSSSVTVKPVDKESGELVKQTKVKKENKQVGTGLTTVSFSGPTTLSLEPGPRWISRTYTLDENTAERVSVPLKRNYFYRQTTQDTNDVANQWLTMKVAEGLQKENEWWSIIINALLSADYELEMMDKSSGYFRTSWMVVQFPNWKARRRFRGNIVNRDPLKWRIKYEIERKKGQIYKTVKGRIFPEDKDVLTQIRSRISPK